MFFFPFKESQTWTLSLKKLFDDFFFLLIKKKIIKGTWKSMPNEVHSTNKKKHSVDIIKITSFDWAQTSKKTHSMLNANYSFLNMNKHISFIFCTCHKMRWTRKRKMKKKSTKFISFFFCAVDAHIRSCANF